MMYCDLKKCNCTFHIITCEEFGKKDCPRVTSNDSHPDPKVGMRTVRYVI